MKSIVVLALGVLLFAVAQVRAAEKWTQWPPGRQEVEANLQIPPNFKKIPSLVKRTDRVIIDGRFRSPDGTAEFAVTAIYARNMEKTVKARTIELPLLPGERVTERTPKEKKIPAEEGDYLLYDEDFIVEGPKGSYTRYFHLELSTGTRPGATSMLWEFKVTDERAKKAYQAIYQQFKKKVNLGED
jgi:hypothetical protein